MADKILDTRIQLKYDTLENWNSSKLVLKIGEIAVVEIPMGDGTQGMTPPAIAIKVGNGTDTFENLPYIQAIAGDVSKWAKTTNLKDAVLTGYTKVTSSGAIVPTDSLGVALSKLENSISASSHSHSNKEILDKITEAFTSTLKGNYDKAHEHSTEDHAPANAEENVIEIVKVNGDALSPSEVDKSVDIKVPTKVSELTNDRNYVTTDTNTTYTFAKGTADGTFSVTPSDGSAKNIDINGFDKTFCDVTYANNALSFRHTAGGTVLKTINLPKEQFLDTAKTKFVNKFAWSTTTYPNSTNPNLEGKPVLVLALKDENNAVTYSFINMVELMDVYTGASTETVDVTVSADNKISANVKKVSTDILAQGANTLVLCCGGATA